MELKPCVQNYDWGKRSTESVVAKLFSLHDPKAETSGSCYAELWMGTHQNGPSTMKATGEALKKVISASPGVLGTKSVSRFGDNLPFLLKVLSIDKALSIQAHPSKEHAEQLHRTRPDLYKDSNHKPELAIALTKFNAMCGFRPFEEIQRFLKAIPELKEIIGNELTDRTIEATESDRERCLKDCFRALMTCPQLKITAQLSSLLQKTGDDKCGELIVLLRTLNSQFPNDVGCFAPFFLNVITLQPGQAIFLGPNEPHAYLEGDCVECMATSDNVVRAGLTPKFKDVETLCEMLVYNGSPAETKLFQPTVEDQFYSVYSPPVPDFAVAKIEVPEESGKFDLRTRHSASILICVSGSATYQEGDLVPGTVVFIPAEQIFCIANITKKLLLFQAMCNL